MSDKKTKHILYLYGVFIGEVHVFVRVRMRSHPSKGVNMELTVRAAAADVTVLTSHSLGTL